MTISSHQLKVASLKVLVIYLVSIKYQIKLNHHVIIIYYLIFLVNMSGFKKKKI
jgi:uncharacterized membrane protein YqjE